MKKLKLKKLNIKTIILIILLILSTTLLIYKTSKKSNALVDMYPINMNNLNNLKLGIYRTNNILEDRIIAIYDFATNETLDNEIYLLPAGDINGNFDLMENEKYYVFYYDETLNKVVKAININNFINTIYNEGVNETENNFDMVKEGVLDVISSPVNVIHDILNFEILGINLSSLALALLSIGLLAFVLKRLL